ncbi:MAG: phosphoribosylanthranilate isomerase [Fimbriimonadaceae bacterium]
MTRVKICGLTRPEDLLLAVELGADAVGFVLEPSSPRCVPPDRLRTLLEAVPVWVSRVLVFGPRPERLPEAPFDWVQCLPPAPPAGRWIGCLRAGPAWDPSQSLEAFGQAEAIVLDAFHPGAFGGTGRTVDWDLAAGFAAQCPKPVILAGGLHPDNVAEAIRAVRPYAVDVSSGVEARPREKDHGRLRAFFEAVRAADAEDRPEGSVRQKKARER